LRCRSSCHNHFHGQDEFKRFVADLRDFCIAESQNKQGMFWPQQS
jgi:hypothetical protein